MNGIQNPGPGIGANHMYQGFQGGPPSLGGGGWGGGDSRWYSRGGQGRMGMGAQGQQGQQGSGGRYDSIQFPGGLGDYWKYLQEPGNPVDSKMMGQAGEYGTFDPGGSQGMSDAISRRFAREGSSRGAAAGINAMSGAGGDPALARYAKMQAGFNNQGYMANAQSNAQLSHMQSAQDFSRNMLASSLISGRDQKFNWAMQREQMNHQGANQPGFWDYASGIAGQALGGWLSGI